MVTPLLDASLDAGDPVEGNIEQTVEDKADNVEGHKVKVEADHALPPPILVNLQGVQKGTTGLFTASVTFDTPLSLARMDRS